MLEPIFGGKNIEKVLFFLLKNQKCYGRELSKHFNESLSPFQKTLDRLETGNILVSFMTGKTRTYQFNPRYPFLKELTLLLEKAYEFLPAEKKILFDQSGLRKRPRKRGKIL